MVSRNGSQRRCTSPNQDSRSPEESYSRRRACFPGAIASGRRPRYTPNTPAIASASRRRVAFSKCPYTLLVTSSVERPRVRRHGVRGQIGHNLAPATPHERTKWDPPERAANGLNMREQFYSRGLLSGAGSARMSDDAKFILGFG